MREISQINITPLGETFEIADTKARSNIENLKENMFSRETEVYNTSEVFRQLGDSEKHDVSVYDAFEYMPWLNEGKYRLKNNNLYLKLYSDYLDLLVFNASPNNVTHILIPAGINDIDIQDEYGYYIRNYSVTQDPDSPDDAKRQLITCSKWINIYALDEGTYANPIILTGEVDLDTIKTPGVYQIDTDTVSGDSGAGGSPTFLVITPSVYGATNGEHGQYIEQHLISNYEGDVDEYRRIISIDSAAKHPGITSWRRIVTDASLEIILPRNTAYKNLEKRVKETEQVKGILDRLTSVLDVMRIECTKFSCEKNSASAEVKLYYQKREKSLTLSDSKGTKSNYLILCEARDVDLNESTNDYRLYTQEQYEEAIETFQGTSFTEVVRINGVDTYYSNDFELVE